MQATIGQVSVTINEAGANFQFPIGDVPLSITVTKLLSSKLHISIMAAGKKLIEQDVRVKADDAKTS